MFGLSFGEIIVLVVVGIVVVGPKNLPALMRTAGQWVAKARRLSFDLRSQSGFDDLIRKEGLEREIQELRSLARINVVDSLMTPHAPFSAGSLAPLKERPEAVPSDFTRLEPLRAREFPLIGCDAYDALADDAVVYPPPPAAASKAAEATADAPNGDAASADATTDEPAAATPGGLILTPAVGTVAWSPAPIEPADAPMPAGKG